MGENNSVDLHLNFLIESDKLDNDLTKLKEQINKTLEAKDANVLGGTVQEIKDAVKYVTELAADSKTWSNNLIKNQDTLHKITNNIFKLIHELQSDPLSASNKSIQSTIQHLREYAQVLDAASRNRFGKPIIAGDITKTISRASGSVKDFNAEAVLAGRTLEEFKKELEEAGIKVPKAFSYKDVEEFNKKLEESKWDKYLNSGKQERWGEEVVARRTELVQEAVKDLAKEVEISTDIANSEEQLNKLEADRIRLTNEQLAIKYNLLEVEKKIRVAESNRIYGGEVLDKESWKMLQEQAKLYRDQYQGYSKQINQVKILEQIVKNNLNTQKTETGEIVNQKEAEKARVAELKKAIRAEQETMKQAKLTTSQYYYRLRSVKMLNKYLDTAKNTINQFGKKATTAFTNVFKSLNKLTAKLKPFNKGMKTTTKELSKHTNGVKSASKAHADFGKTLKTNLTTLLKYTLGIRSLYVLFNRLRGAAADGMEIMATQYGAVNGTMSDIVTSLYQMKNALTTAIQPLTLVVAPVLAKLAEVLSTVTAKIASFFAAFTGQKTVYKAIRVNQEYIEGLKEEKEAMEDLNKEELAHYDMLNVISDEKKKEDEEDLSNVIGFEEIPIEATMSDWMKKLKDFLKALLAPMLNAWNKWKDELYRSFKEMLGKIKKLLSDILRDFLKVWGQQRTQEIFENLLETLRNIFDFIGIIAEKLDEAWNHADNGLRIFMALRDIIWIISKLLVRMSEYLVNWAKDLSFIPLFDAIRKVLETQIVPAVEKICDLVFTLWQALLEIVRYVIEEFGPKLIEIYGDLWEIAGNIAENINDALSNGDDAFDEADRLYRILQLIEGCINIILDGLKECTEATIEWSKELDFVPLFDTLEQVLREDIQPAVQQIVDLFTYLYEELVLPMGKYLLEELAPQMERIFGDLVGTVGNLAQGIREALEEGDKGKVIVEGIQWFISLIADTIETCTTNTKLWAESLNFSPLIESILTAMEKMSPLIEFIANTLSALWNEVVLPFVGYLVEEGLPKLNEMLGNVAQAVDWEHLNTKVKEFLEAFELFLEKGWETLVIILGDIGEAIAKFVNSEAFDMIVDTFIRWVENADPEDMAKGVEALVKAFIGLQAALNLGSAYGHFIEFVMTLINWHNNKDMTKTIAASTKEISKLKEAIEGGKDASKAAADMADDAAEVAAGAAGAAGKAAEGAANATGATSKLFGVLQKFGGIFSIISGAFMSLGGFTDQLQNGFSLTGIAVTGLGDALIGLGLVALGVVSGPIGAAIAIGIFLLQEFFVAVKQEMDEFGESLPEAIDSIFNKLGEFIGKLFRNLGEVVGELLGNFVGYIVESISSWIDSYNGDFLQLGIDIVLGMLQIFTLPVRLGTIIVKAIAQLVAGFVEGLREGFQTHSPSQHPDIIQVGIDILLGLLGGIASKIVELPAWLLSNVVSPFIQSMGETFSSVWEDLKKIGSDLMDNLNEGVSSGLETIKETVATAWENIKTKSEELWSNIVDSVKESWDNLKEDASEKYENIRSTIEEAWNNVKENTQSTWNNIKDELSTTWDNLKEEGSSRFDELKNNISNTWEEIKSTASSVWDEITTDIKSKWENIVSSVGSAVNNLKETVAQKWDDVKRDASDKWSSIKAEVENKADELNNVRDNMERVGGNLIDGLRQGIDNAWSSASEHINSLWSDISNGACEFFGIHSPSKLFAYYGDMITQGFVKGIEDDEDSANEAVENLIPGLRAFDNLYDKVISTLSLLRQDAISIVDSMILAISDSFASLDKLDVLGAVSAQMSKLETMKIPDIVTGKVVSPQMEVIVNTDNTKLESLLEEVLTRLDEISASEDSSSSDIPDVVLQLDRAEIARAVWDESEKRYRQTGRKPVYT